MPAAKFLMTRTCEICGSTFTPKTIISKYGKSQQDLGNGWLLITHSNNPMKKAFIEKISEVLHLGIKVTLNDNND